MRKNGKIAISMLLILVILSGIIKSLAVNFELNVKFDGKNISMESETPDMNWDLDNLLPGQSDVSSINIKNSGKKEVDLETSINIEEDTGLLEKIELTVTNKAGDTVFTGKYKDLKKITKRLKVGETEKYTVSTKLSVDAGNEYQDKKYKLKFNFNAIGSISVGKLTIKYVDEDGNDIEPPTVETKEITNKYDLPTVGKDIDGYKFVKVEGPTSGEYKEEGTTVIYHYKKITYNKLTVKYVSDTEDGKILKQIQETKETGTEYKYTPEQFEGYEYTGIVDGEPEGIFGKEDKEIIFHYKKIEEIKTGKVIIIYIDEDNNVLEKDEEIDKDKLLKLLEDNNNYIIGLDNEETKKTIEENLEQIVKTINHTYRINKLNLVWKQREASNKKTLANQLGGVSKVISSLADDIEDKEEKEEEKIQFNLKIASARITKSKSEVSGDTSVQTKLHDGKFMMAISDGMGSRTKS